ncbi:hypothetical protein BBF93_14355 [Hyphomonas sp. CACIAM 19H1]|nr:hypothetical protein BBF93_14355 [Hyphomonas sp. CACIAM 19H1]
MMSRSMLFAIIIALVIGFVGGFVLRPILLPPQAVTSALASEANPQEARGVAYFVAHVDEARRVVAGCRDGTVRGGECTNAETAVTTVESRERFRRFREDR